MVYYPTREKYFSEAEAENIFLSTSDNQRIHGFLVHSSIADAPILISFHGNAENANMGLDFAYHYRRMGISVILADYRGYGKCEGNPTEENTYSDALLYYRYALSLVPQNRIIIHGRSLGGAVAVHLAVNNPSAGIILESTFTTAEEVFGMPEKILGVKYRSIDIIDKIKCPVLFIHGVEDDLVPFQMGKQLYEKVKTEKEMLPVERAGHNDVYYYLGESYLEKIAGFVKKCT